jgi:SAM-dependent methyltransferase
MVDGSSMPPGPVLRAKLLVARTLSEAAAARDDVLVSTGSALGRLGRRLTLRPHLREVIRPPTPIELNGIRFDVAADLAAYTGLPLTAVDALLRRRIDSFRAEWHLTPTELRVDDWYYRATTAYLFGNATHDPASLVATIEEHCGDARRVLDFGGGSGNLALALALAPKGWSVDYLERSALQKDFVRFRIHRYGLGERVRVLDDWNRLESNTYDLVCALDVFEHLGDLDTVLAELLPSIRLRGGLLESSPYVRNLSNPMHHEHQTLDSTLIVAGLELEVALPSGRLWRRVEY